MSGVRAAVWLAVTAAAWAWIALVIAAPAWRGIPGGTGVLATAAYLVGGTVCHQMPERSFALAGVSLPVCARCTGLYAGGAVGLLAWGLRPRRRTPAATRRALVRGLAITAVPTALSLALVWTLGLDTANAPRALLAVPLGAAVGAALAAAARGEVDEVR